MQDIAGLKFAAGGEFRRYWRKRLNELEGGIAGLAIQAFLCYWIHKGPVCITVKDLEVETHD